MWCSRHCPRGQNPSENETYKHLRSWAQCGPGWAEDRQVHGLTGMTGRKCPEGRKGEKQENCRLDNLFPDARHGEKAGLGFSRGVGAARGPWRAKDSLFSCLVKNIRFINIVSKGSVFFVFSEILPSPPPSLSPSSCQGRSYLVNPVYASILVYNQERG